MIMARHRLLFRLTWTKNKGAVLIIMWCFLSTHVFYLLRDGFVNVNKDPLNVSYSGIPLLVGILLAPIGGWIADSWLGRYKTVKYSIWIMWVGAMLATFGEFLSYVSPTYDARMKVWTFRVLLVVIGIGLVGYQSNIVQFGIDQLNDASADDIKSFVLWFWFASYFSCIVLKFVTECTALKLNMYFIKILFIASCLTLVLCLDYVFQHCLVKQEFHRKPLYEIVRVLKYIINNSSKRFEYAVDNNTEKVPSRFDIAKHGYGGPYTSVQVDNVRTFLWMLAVLATSSVVLGVMMPVDYARDYVQHRWSGFKESKDASQCYQNLLLRYEDYIVGCGCIVLYDCVIHPIFYKCIRRGFQSIANRFVLGTVCILLWVLSLLAIEVAAFSKVVHTANNSHECIFYDHHDPIVRVDRGLLLIPDVISSVAFLLMLTSALEFIWAQAPTNMKGLMFGSAYALLGLNTLIQTAISLPFIFNVREINWNPLTCSVWYFIMQSCFIFVALIIVISIVQKYKKRDKNGQKMNVYTAHSTGLDTSYS